MMDSSPGCVLRPLRYELEGALLGGRGERYRENESTLARSFVVSPATVTSLSTEEMTTTLRFTAGVLNLEDEAPGVWRGRKGSTNVASLSGTRGLVAGSEDVVLVVFPLFPATLDLLVVLVGVQSGSSSCSDFEAALFLAVAAGLPCF